MTDKKVKKEPTDIENYFIEASYTRAHIIGRVVMLESMMDIFLSTHFCKTKSLQNEIMEIIFGTLKISTDSKRDAMNAIMNKHHKEFLKNNKFFNTDVQNIIAQRNIFAHYPIFDFGKGLSLYKLDKTISFLKFRNSKEMVSYTKKDIEYWFKKITDNTKLLVDLIKTMEQVRAFPLTFQRIALPKKVTNGKESYFK